MGYENSSALHRPLKPVLVDSSSTYATKYAYENADRGRNSNQGVDEAVLVGDFDIPAVGTEFVSLRGGVERHAKPSR
jgi:hypothetical protein